MNDDNPPIPPNHSRISVQIGEALHRLQIETAEIEDCAEAFEEAFSHPLKSYRHTPAGDLTVHEIARQSARLGFTVIVGQAALWLLLYSAERDVLQAVRDEMWRLVTQDGGVHIIATYSAFSRGWKFEVSPTAVAALGEAANPWPAAPADLTLN
jgi:hypothetical protein